MKRQRFPLEVGQKVYLKETENTHFRTNNLLEAEIEKIAKKYFYVKHGYWGNLRFDLETYEYSPRASKDRNAGFNLYSSREAYAREMELQRKEDKIFFIFRNNWGRFFTERLIETVYAALSEEGIIKEEKENV